MAPPLRLDDWSRLYEPAGLTHLYWRAIPSVLHASLGEGWQYCETEDPVQALAWLVFNYHHIPEGRGWELAWSNNGDVTVIANSESREHFLGLINRSNFFAERDGNFRLRKRA